MYTSIYNININENYHIGAGGIYLYIYVQLKHIGGLIHIYLGITQELCFAKIGGEAVVFTYVQYQTVPLLELNAAFCDLLYKREARFFFSVLRDKLTAPAAHGPLFFLLHNLRSCIMVACTQHINEWRVLVTFLRPFVCWLAVWLFWCLDVVMFSASKLGVLGQYCGEGRVPGKYLWRGFCCCRWFEGGPSLPSALCSTWLGK